MPRTKRGLTHGHVKDIATSWARERPDLDPVDYLLPIYLIRIGRIVDRMGDHRWQKRFGLSSAEIRVLFALRRSGGEYARRPTDLFRALLVTSGAISKKVERLGAEGLVKRTPDPTDKGGALIKLTPKGKKIADEALSSLADKSIVARGRITLSQEKRRLLTKLCEQLLLDFEADPEISEIFE
jgi:DNA-binding MarR family transcriptional regulator